MDKPNTITTEADCQQLAQYEWENEIGTDAQKQWPNMEAYIANRMAQFKARYRVKDEPKKRDVKTH